MLQRAQVGIFSVHEGHLTTLRNVCLLDLLSLTFFGVVRNSTLSTTKNLGLFSSFLKMFLRNVGSITQCNLGVHWCQGISEEWLRSLYSICKAKPNLLFKPNCSVLFANPRAPEGA